MDEQMNKEAIQEIMVNRVGKACFIGAHRD